MEKEVDIILIVLYVNNSLVNFAVMHILLIYNKEFHSCCKPFYYMTRAAINLIL